MDNNEIKKFRFGEVVFDITSQCYTKLMEYWEDDSRQVWAVISEWAEEFENWWNTLSEDEQDRRDYMLSVEEFAEKKLREQTLKEYHVNLEKVLSRWFTVKAENEDEAIELAAEQAEDIDLSLWCGADNGISYVGEVKEV